MTSVLNNERALFSNTQTNNRQTDIGLLITTCTARHNETLWNKTYRCQWMDTSL